jgi:hypothetical protein
MATFAKTSIVGYQRLAKLLQDVTALHTIAYVMSSRAITFLSNNGSNFDREITLGCDNGSNEQEEVIFRTVLKRYATKSIT